MLETLRISVHDSSQVGEARRAAIRLGSDLGSDEEWLSRVGIVVTELAQNLALHAVEGEVILRLLKEPYALGLEIMSLDKGPGMSNVADCFRDGFSTAGTPGTGLGAARRLTNAFDLYTSTKNGTVICCKVSLQKGPDLTRAANPQATLGVVSVAVTGETVCGDGWAIQTIQDRTRALVVDGLGHGHYANEAAQEALSIFNDSAGVSMPDVMERIHKGLGKTRGAGASLAEVDSNAGKLTALGVGNIVTRQFGDDGSSRQVAPVNGTLGSSFRKPREVELPWSQGDVLIMHSDGLTTRWDFTNHPGLLSKHPSLIAGVLYRDFARERDDSTVLALSFPP